MVFVELKKLLKEGIIVLLILTALLGYIFTSDKDPFVPSVIFEIFLLLYAAYTGWSMFDRERQENAVEYLLSVPISRTRLFFLKFAPRCFSVLVLLGGYLLLHHWFDFPAFLTYFDFAIFYIAFFLVAMSFSISLKNFIGALFLTGFFSIGLTVFLKFVVPSMPESNAIRLANLVMLIFPISFFFAFQSFDIKPLRNFHWRFIPPLIIVLGLVMGYHWLQRIDGYHRYHLTRAGNVFQGTCLQTRYIGDGDIVTLEDCGGVLADGGDFFITQVRTHKEYCHEIRVERLELKDLSRQPLLEIEEGWVLGYGIPGRTGIIKNQKYYNLLVNSGEKKYKIIILDGSNTKQIHIYGNFEPGSNMQLIQVIEDPLQFLILSESNLYRVLETGEAFELPFKTSAVSVWQNRLLVFESGGMTMYEISNQLTPIFQRRGNIEKVTRRWGSHTQQVVIFQEGKQFFMLRMDDLVVIPLEMKNKPRYYAFYDGNVHVVWKRGDRLIYALMDPETGKLEYVKKWLVTLKAVRYWILPYPWGILVFDSQDYQKFMFMKKSSKNKK